MQKPDVWDGGDSKGTLSITPKNRWCQHSQIAINTLSAFARQLSTLTNGLVYIQIQKNTY